MVVLESAPSESRTVMTNSSRMQSYYNSQYVQPLPNEVNIFSANNFEGKKLIKYVTS